MKVCNNQIVKGYIHICWVIFSSVSSSEARTSRDHFFFSLDFMV